MNEDPASLLPLPNAAFHILLAVADEDRHGYGIIQDVAARTSGELKLSAGTLYRSIQRMLEQGLLVIETRQRPEPEDDDERRRYYRITPYGREVADGGSAAHCPNWCAWPAPADSHRGRRDALCTASCCICTPRHSAPSTARKCAAIFAQRLRDASHPLLHAALWIGTPFEVLFNALCVHLDMLCQDLRYTARTLIRSPAFTFTAIVVAALGIGATTAAFTLIDHVLVRPLPFPDQHRLVKLWQSHSLNGARFWDMSPANYRDWKRLSHIL